jgi:pyridinium-3,5-bisthiocarboxylic acid mononucleotide nickel chelatase
MSNKIAYFDCFSGISGDMTLGAFISLGVPVSFIKEKIAESLIDKKYFDIEAVDKKINGILAKSVNVKALEDNEKRDFSFIKSLIEKSLLSDFVKKKSILAFEKIAKAESHIHGTNLLKTHFHELGGIDAIVDIVGSMLCVEYLQIEKIYASKIPIGSGFISCMHGILPCPAPATLEILKDIPVYGSDIPFELTTPTGAVIISALADSFGEYPEMLIKTVGYGAGKKAFKKFPNLLRIVLGEASFENYLKKENIFVIEASIDNMNPELYGSLMEKLFENNALDVCFIPVYMKKNRPGIIVKVLSKKNTKDSIIKTILYETTSIGVRYYEAKREILKREEAFIKTKFGRIKAKKITEIDGSIRISPEYEECKKIAKKLNIPIIKIYNKINKLL